MTERSFGIKLWISFTGLHVHFLLCCLLKIFLFFWAIFIGTWKIQDKTKCCKTYRYLVLMRKCSHLILCWYFRQIDYFMIHWTFLVNSHLRSCHFWPYNIPLGRICLCLFKSSLLNRSCQMPLFMTL